MAIALDGSAPANVTQTGNLTTTIVTASFTPPNNSLVVALCGHVYNGAGTAGNTFAVTDSLSGSWTSSTSIQSANASHAGVFTQLIGSGSAMTVTLTTDAVKKGKQLTVVVLTGTAQTNWIGANIKTFAGTTAGNLQQTCTTTTVGSWVLVSTAYDTTGTIPVNANTTQLFQLADATDGARISSGYMTTPTVTAGTISLGWTGDSTSQKSYVACEILPPALDPWVPAIMMNPAALTRADYY